MSKADVYNLEGKKVGEVDLSEAVFGLPENESLVHQVYVAQAANRRTGSAHTKVRSEVRGGGKKPWKQKGTGNARTGSIRNPIWRGGGTVFGPSKDKNYSKDINVKMRRKALLIVLSQKAKAGKLVVMETLVLPENKTKIVSSAVNAIGLTSFVMGLSPDESGTYKAARNIPKTTVMEVTKLNVKDLLDRDTLVVSQGSLAEIEKNFVK